MGLVQVLKARPFLLQLEEAAKEVADEVTRPRPSGEEVLQDIQVMLKSDASPSGIRSLKVGPLLCVTPAVYFD